MCTLTKWLSLRLFPFKFSLALLCIKIWKSWFFFLMPFKHLRGGSWMNATWFCFSFCWCTALMMGPDVKICLYSLFCNGCDLTLSFTVHYASGTSIAKFPQDGMLLTQTLKNQGEAFLWFSVLLLLFVVFPSLSKFLWHVADQASSGSQVSEQIWNL